MVGKLHLILVRWCGHGKGFSEALVKAAIYFLQTASSLGTFFCAMAMFPEVQAKAQRDIDLIIGSERLVNFDDMSSLPYIEALRREAMRWRPVAPLGLMRAANSDDVYKGYYIPKGMYC
jgi:cytochrome P450